MATVIEPEEEAPLEDEPSAPVDGPVPEPRRDRVTACEFGALGDPPAASSPDEGVPEDCEVDPVSSRGCERGTPGCVTQHADRGEPTP